MKRALRNWPLLLVLFVLVGTGTWLTWEVIKATGEDETIERETLTVEDDESNDDDHGVVEPPATTPGPLPPKAPPPEPKTPEAPPPIEPSAVTVPAVESEPEHVVPENEAPPVKAHEVAEIPRAKSTPFRSRPRHDTSGGRAELPAVRGVVIGTPTDVVQNLMKRHPTLEALSAEAPLHRRDIEGFLMDRMEVSNAQFQLYLADVTRETNVTSLANVRARSKTEWAKTLVDPAFVPDNPDWGRFAQQIARTTPGVFGVDATPAKDNPDEVHDGEWARWLTAPLPRSRVEIPIYRRLPPRTWTSLFPSRDQMPRPVRGVSFHEALAFADWAGKHIPTEYEWEYAARGKRGRAFPWGGSTVGWQSFVHFEDAKQDERDMETLPIDRLSQGATPEDIRHLLGNVSEWTSSFLDPYPGGTESHYRYQIRTVRGGSVASADRIFLRSTCRAWTRESSQPQDPSPRDGTPYANRRLTWTGFRCASFAREQGASHARNMVAWASSSPFAPWVVLPERTNEFRYDGYFWRDHALPGNPVESGMFVGVGAQWIAVTPINYVSLRTQEGAAATAVDETTREGFVARSHGHGLPLAIISTSFEIAQVWIDASRDLSSLSPSRPFGRPERLRITLAPRGCYVLVFHAGWLALRSTRTAEMYYLSRRAMSVSSLPLTWSTHRENWDNPRVPELEFRDGPAVSNTSYSLKLNLPVRPENERVGHGRLALSLRLKIKRAQRRDEPLVRLTREQSK